MYLVDCKRVLDKRVKLLNDFFSSDVITSRGKRRIYKNTVCEGVISSLWQSWCHFCRSVVIDSTIGTTTSNGHITTSPFSHLNERQLITLSLKLCRQEKIPAQIAMANGWVDLAWGDAEKINKIIAGIGMSNKEILLSSFGAVNHLKSLQKSRNACSHISSYTIENLKNIRVYYNDNSLMHPADVMFWVVPETGEFLWKAWIEEIDLISSIIIC